MKIFTSTTIARIAAIIIVLSVTGNAVHAQTTGIPVGYEYYTDGYYFNPSVGTYYNSTTGTYSSIPPQINSNNSAIYSIPSGYTFFGGTLYYNSNTGMYFDSMTGQYSNSNTTNGTIYNAGVIPAGFTLQNNGLYYNPVTGTYYNPQLGTYTMNVGPGWTVGTTLPNTTVYTIPAGFVSIGSGIYYNSATNQYFDSTTGQYRSPTGTSQVSSVYGTTYPTTNYSTSYYPTNTYTGTSYTGSTYYPTSYTVGLPNTGVGGDSHLPLNIAMGAFVLALGGVAVFVRAKRSAR